MKYTPNPDWKWSYGDPKNEGVTYLVLNMISDTGVPCCFKTRFTKMGLGNPPAQDQSFVIEDANLLNAYMNGLSSTQQVDDSICFDLALNAVACERFVYLTNPLPDYFKVSKSVVPVYKGQIVSLYAKQGGVGDFIVLNNQPIDGIYKLMLLNPSWCISGYDISLGQMVRVPIECIAPSRLFEQQRRTA